jgi:hypothetical protein
VERSAIAATCPFYRSRVAARRNARWRWRGGAPRADTGAGRGRDNQGATHVRPAGPAHLLHACQAARQGGAGAAEAEFSARGCAIKFASPGESPGPPLAAGPDQHCWGLFKQDARRPNARSGCLQGVGDGGPSPRWRSAWKRALTLCQPHCNAMRVRGSGPVRPSLTHRHASEPPGARLRAWVHRTGRWVCGLAERRCAGAGPARVPRWGRASVGFKRCGLSACGLSAASWALTAAAVK